MTQSLYDTLRWRATAARARRRDGDRCTVARLLGGECSAGTRHAHHIRPVSDGGEAFDLENVATVCSAHHPAWEALRRSLLHAADRFAERPIFCRHQHRSAEARAQCEARMRRHAQARTRAVA